MAFRNQSPELQYDPSPEYAVEVRSDGAVSHFMSFDPRYGPESDDQIAYFQRRNYPGSDSWEIGKSIKVAAVRDAIAAESSS